MIKKIPCGGFYVNDDAVEMIDGKPVLKTSGSDKVLENAKQTGGIGYTEQGEQTVIVDNESITTVDTEGAAVGQFATPFDIVDGAYTVIFNGTEYNLNSTFDERDGCWFLGDSGDWSQYPFAIYGDALITESAGDYEITVIMGSDTIHRVEGKYLPEGGIGWTEQGEQTVITWDGDTEGLVSVSLGAAAAYKISDLIVPNSAIVGMSITLSDERTITITQPIYEKLVEMGEISDDISALPDDAGVIFVRQNGVSQSGITFPEIGVYVIKGVERVFASSLAYSTPDTIHKIDEKYLPDKEIVVKVTYDAENNEWVSDKTYQELNAYANAGVNIKCFLSNHRIVTVCNLMSYIGGEEI